MSALSTAIHVSPAPLVILASPMPVATDSNDPARHHYVPRAYLAPFTDNGTTARGRLWVYGRSAAQPPTREPLMAVAFEPHMYTMPDEGEMPSPALEHRFARDIERPFTAWHRRVVKARRGTAPAVMDRMSRSDRVVVARYVLYQHLRTPAQRLFAARLAALSHQAHVTDPQTRASYLALWERLGLQLRPPLTSAGHALDFEAFFVAMRLRIQRYIDADPTRWLRPIGRFAEALVPVLVDERAWRIVELPDDIARATPLFTCDNPVVLVRPHAEPVPERDSGWEMALGGGWNEPAVEATLTLSPRHALMIALDPSTLTAADEPARLAASLRVRTARHALQHVYARSADERIAALVRATRGPDVVYEVGGVRLPARVDAREVIRRAEEAGTAQIGVRFTDE